MAATPPSPPPDPGKKPAKPVPPGSPPARPASEEYRFDTAQPGSDPLTVPPPAEADATAMTLSGAQTVMTSVTRPAGMTPAVPPTKAPPASPAKTPPAPSAAGDEALTLSGAHTILTALARPTPVDTAPPSAAPPTSTPQAPPAGDATVQTLSGAHTILTQPARPITAAPTPPVGDGTVQTLSGAHTILTEPARPRPVTERFTATEAPAQHTLSGSHTILTEPAAGGGAQGTVANRTRATEGAHIEEFPTAQDPHGTRRQGGVDTQAATGGQPGSRRYNRTRVNSKLPPDTQLLDQKLQLSRPSVLVDMAAATGEQMPAGLAKLVAEQGTGGRYLINRPLAAGGMGAVLHIIDGDFQRGAAMKVIHGKYAKDPASLERFLQEAQVTAQLEHPNIVPIHDLGAMEDGSLYYTMKLLRGQSLGDVLKLLKSYDRKTRPAPPAADGSAPTPPKPPEAPTPQETAAVATWTLDYKLLTFLKVLDGIGYANARGVVHRDIKPDNIMLGANGEVTVVDWGIAKILGKAEIADELIKSIRDEQSVSATMDGAAMGTPTYMPPEQASGDKDRVDARSDIYALGATLYELVSHKRYLEGKTAQELVAKCIAGEGIPIEKAAPGLHADLAAIIRKAMAYNPEQRYQSCAAFAADVRAYMSGAAVSARRRNLIERIGAWYGRNKRKVQVGVVGVVLVAGTVVVQGKLDAANRRQQAEALIAQAQTEVAALGGRLDEAVFISARDKLTSARTLAKDHPGIEPVADAIKIGLAKVEEQKDRLAALELSRKHRDEALRLRPTDLEAAKNAIDLAYKTSKEDDSVLVAWRDINQQWSRRETDRISGEARRLIDGIHARAKTSAAGYAEPALGPALDELKALFAKAEQARIPLNGGDRETKELAERIEQAKTEATKRAEAESRRLADQAEAARLHQQAAADFAAVNAKGEASMEELRQIIDTLVRADGRDPANPAVKELRGRLDGAFALAKVREERLAVIAKAREQRAEAERLAAAANLEEAKKVIDGAFKTAPEDADIKASWESITAKLSEQQRDVRKKESDRLVALAAGKLAEARALGETSALRLADPAVIPLIDAARLAFEKATTLGAPAGIEQAAIDLAKQAKLAGEERAKRDEDAKAFAAGLADAKARLAANDLDAARTALDGVRKRGRSDEFDALSVTVAKALDARETERARAQRLTDARRNAGEALAKAKAGYAAIGELRTQLAALADEITRLDAQLKNADYARKKPLFDARLKTKDTQSVLTQRWTATENEAHSALSHLAEEPGNPVAVEARQLLAQLYFDRLVDVRAQNLLSEVAAYTALVARFDTEKRFLKDLGTTGTLALNGPAGTTVSVHRVAPGPDTRLVPSGDPVARLALPAAPAVLPKGRYQLSAGDVVISLVLEAGASVDLAWPGALPVIKDPDIALRYVPALGPNRKAFLLGQTEVTHAQYLRFVTDKAIWPRVVRSYRSITEGEAKEGTPLLFLPRLSMTAPNLLWVKEPEGIEGLERVRLGRIVPDLPVTSISRADAEGFCAWLSDRLRMRVRLPSQAEWQFAADGGDRERLYPWGEFFDHALTISALPNNDAPMDVRSRPTDLGPFGHLGLAGNVREWLADPYGPVGQLDATIAGAAFSDNKPDTFRCTYFENVHGAGVYAPIGFRILVELP